MAKVYFLAGGDEIVEAEAIIFYTQRRAGSQVALHDVHGGQAVEVEIDQQPLLPVQLVEAARFYAQPQLDKARAQVVVQVDDVSRTARLAQLLPLGRSGGR